MSETGEEVRVLQGDKPKRRKLGVSAVDLIIFAALAALCVGLAIIIESKLTLKHDVAKARVVADKTIDDLQNRDGAAARKLGTPTFQSTYSAETLTQQFKNVEIATLKKPGLDTQGVYDGAHGRNAYFIYRYTALKVPYYVRVTILGNHGKWQLTDISGSADVSTLIP